MQIIKEMDYRPNILASTLASKKSAQFATLFPEPPSPDGYWTRPVIGIKKRVSELRQYGIQVQPFTFNQAEPDSFVEKAHKILELKPDGVVFAPFFKNESTQFIKKLKELDIPFVFIDSDIKNAGQLGFIGQNSFQSGLVSGKLLSIIVPEGNILVVHFAKEMDNQNHLVQRKKGFYEWFSKSSKTLHQLFTIEVSDTSDENWMNDIADFIKKNKIKGIFVTNSKVYNIGRLVERQSLSGLKVIGHDLLKENVDYLKKEIVHFLICQQPEEQGYKAINKIFRSVVQKRTVTEIDYSSIDIITKENIDFYKEFKK